jgi:hypothetical protein
VNTIKRKGIVIYVIQKTFANIVVKNIHVKYVKGQVYVFTIKEKCYVIYALLIYGVTIIDLNVNVKIVEV